MKFYYRLISDLEIISLGNETILFKSEKFSVRIKGKSVNFFVKEVFPLLDGENDLELICLKIKKVSLPDLRQGLDKLLNAGLLQCDTECRSATSKISSGAFFDNFLYRHGMNFKESANKLNTTRIALIGLEAHGSQTLLALRQCGFRNFKISDPFNCDDGFISIFPFFKNEFSGKSRQDCVARYFETYDPTVKIATGPVVITKKTLQEFVSDCDLIIVCFDAGFTSTFYWINQISVETGIPSLYATVKESSFIAGPLVVPSVTSCYMCYKMCYLATRNDIEEAWALENHFIGKKRPSFNKRNAIPSTLNTIAGVISSEAVKYFLDFTNLSLTNRILEFDSISFQSTTHHVRQMADCKVCKKKTADLILPLTF